MATLTVTGRSDVAAVAADIDGVGQAARNAATDVAAVDDAARQSGAGLDALGEAGDNVASKSSQATGALGALSGGLEAIGATGAASALSGVAIATDVASGAGDALNLVAETAVGKYVAQTAASIAHRTALIAGTVATTAMSVAQGALNAVLSANPIGLLVVGILAATAGIILLYRNSETFREIVKTVFDAAASYVGFYIDVIQGVIDIFADLPGKAKAAWDSVSGFIGDAMDDAQKFVSDLVDDAIRLPREAASTVAGYFSDMFAPIQTAIGWVQDLIDKIKSIDFPDFPSINLPGGDDRGFEDGGVTRTVGGEFAPLPTNVKFELTAAVQDQDASMAAFVEAAREFFQRRGMTLALTETPA